MNLTIMNFNRIRDLVLNLGFKDDNNEGYVPRTDCLASLEKLENELLNEDEVNRNVRITLHICGTVQKDLLPILSSKVDAKLITTATRILVNMSLPVEYLISHQKLPTTPKIQRVHKNLFASSLALKKAFLNVPVTLSLVTILRETIIKSEKQLVPLTDEDCNHLKNCLFLLRNILHLPDSSDIVGENPVLTYNNWQSIQSKLIWNLFVQGIDGALLLMFNSKYRKHWTVPLALILGSLYRNQNSDNVLQTLELISSASEDSDDEQESDGSKNSYTSSSSEPFSKIIDLLSDSACTFTAVESFPLKSGNRDFEQSKCETSSYVYTVPEIRTDLEKVQISNDSGRILQNHQSNCLKDDQSGKLKVALSSDGINYGDSSPCVSPYHKRIKGNPPPPLKEVPPLENPKCKKDSGISEGCFSFDMMDIKLSDDDGIDAKTEKQTKTVQHHRNLQLNCKKSVSDSCNEFHRMKVNEVPSHASRICKRDSGISDDYLSSDMMDIKSSDDDVIDAKTEKQTKSVQHHRSLQLNCKKSVCDSCNESHRMQANEVLLHTNRRCKRDSGISEGCLSSDMMDIKLSDDDVFDAKPEKQTKTVQHHRSLQMNTRMSESDSSNDDVQNKKIKHRCHAPNVKRSKNSRRSSACSPSICMDSALEALYSKGRIRYPLLKKRNSVSTLVGINSSTPSNVDIGNLLKEFTLSFLHSGFSKLVLDLKDLFLKGQHLDIDKSVLFWVVSYFLPIATAAHIPLDHIREIINVDVIGVLVFECVNVCENVEIHSRDNEKVVQYVTVQMKLLTIALKEVLNTMNNYLQKCNSTKDREFFNELNGKLAGLKDLRNLPLLLLQIYLLINNQHFLEDVALINHQIMVIIGRGVDYCWKPNKINFISHLKLFSTKDIVHCYGKLLKNFRSNSKSLNDCVFTMMHHLSGDIRSIELLFVPSILMNFSDILEEEFELEQYQEDLIMYVLNKFAFKTCQEALKKKKRAAVGDLSEASNYSFVSSYDSLPSEDDDLYWWYLQFEQDKDPISRIAEHISLRKQDILFKLKLKGYISLERYKQLTEVLEEADGEIVEIPSLEFKKMPNFDDDITNLLQTLVHDGQRHHLLWVQEVLLETCNVKQGSEKKLVEPVLCYSISSKNKLQEPVPCYSIKMLLSVPLVPYCEGQRKILKDETFVLLLQKLGLHLDSGVCQIYPRIPLYWTTDMLFSIACRLGPISKDQLKFTYEELSNSNFELAVTKNDECPALPPLSSCCTLSSWLTAVQQSKVIYRTKQKNLNVFEPIS